LKTLQIRVKIRAIRLQLIDQSINYFYIFQIEGQEAEVMGERCNEQGIKVLKISNPSRPKFHYDPPNPNSFGDGPLIGW